MQPEPEILQKISSAGTLDNKTILRFSHALSGGAGVEAHIDNLNRILLSRNAVKILYLYLPEETTAVVTEISLGKGTLVKIPLLVDRSFTEIKNPLKEKLYRHRSSLLVSVLRRSASIIKYVIQYVKYKTGKPLFMQGFREAFEFDIFIRRILKDYSVDLVINHFPGGRDSSQLMHAATENRIPILVINHFDNIWYNYIPIRQQLTKTRYAAGVTATNVPRYLRRRFIYISNGIDTDFFDPCKVLPRAISKYPVLLLPARITPDKGHMDLLYVALRLKLKNLPCFLVFAGRLDSTDFEKELYSFIRSNNLRENVLFTGVLDPEGLRQHYKSSTLVVLPTYHEGFGRVVVEAQSMGVPPVAYDTGGLKQSIITEKTGILVKRGDKRRLSDRIEELLLDKQKRIRMGQAGRDYVVNNFSLTTLACRHEKAYDMIIRGEPAVKVSRLISQ
ncbi:MAG: glycosyltransferase family 4 protein [Fibrobacter sp.]|nr:glycosyltransferase family 4 protein [Fibrobacter sp.]